MRHLHALIVATGLCVPSLALAAPASPEATQRPVAAHVHSTQAETQTAVARNETAQSDRARYAEKEAQSGEAKDYRGGDTVVIGATAATAILAVLLLVILL